MSEITKDTSQNSQERTEVEPRSTPDISVPQQRREAKRWWMKLFLQPILFLAAGAALFTGLGIAQRLGWLSGGGQSGQHQLAAAGANTRYICPMMCTPPQSEPGRCPVCAMELVPSTSGAGKTDSQSIQVDPVARRLAGIRTVAVKAVSFSRTIRAIGELCYDEGTLKTISAYVDGRLDRLYADYTGVKVKKGDHLALVYSPALYSGQVELLAAMKTRGMGRSSLGDLYQSSRQKLLDLGMTKEQIDRVEKTGKANSRIYLCAPISGTVIEKFAEKGQYVKEGRAIYKLTGLSTVWLMLKMFPEDAAVMRYGQKVNVDVQSLPGRNFTGRVAFIDPMVERKTRTVGVRVVLANDHGLLRVGDYAKATIEVPLSGSGELLDKICDPELAKKWISPRHPHITASLPGTCKLCGVDLVPASQFGFTNEPFVGGKSLVVPRDAVLMAGDNSVVYVETEPGRFEIRRVILGPSSGDQIVIRKGVKEGESVATSGNFLIDSQMQLAGNPSLIDPMKAKPKNDTKGKPKRYFELTDKMKLALAKLRPEDAVLAKKQRICPVADMALGSMGTPIKVDVTGTPVFICCEGCRKKLLEQPKRYLEKLAANPNGESKSKETPKMSVPPIGVPMLVVPESKSPVTKEPEKGKYKLPMEGGK